MDSLQGQLLIASPRLVDPNFVRSIVVMVQHNDDGALGLIVNRPLQTTIKEVCEKALDIPCEIEAALHQGGPCEGPLMVVHTNETQSDIEVFPGVYFTTDREKIEWLMNHNDGAIKFFVGYAGWAAGQLLTCRGFADRFGHLPDGSDDAALARAVRARRAVRGDRCSAGRLRSFEL